MFSSRRARDDARDRETARRDRSKDASTSRAGMDARARDRASREVEKTPAREAVGDRERRASTRTTREDVFENEYRGFTSRGRDERSYGTYARAEGRDAEEYAWMRRGRAEERASGGSRAGPHRDQFLTSAMLCVGAVSVCIVSVMIAGGLAFVGLSENAAVRTSGMDFVRNGADAWTSAGGYRARGADGGGVDGALYAPSPNARQSPYATNERFDYFAQPDRLDQSKLIDELDRRYGERLQAMMRQLRASSESGDVSLTSTQTRGEDPSFLPPAPMTEEEREMNTVAENVRRLPNQRLPSVEDDDDKDEDEDEKEMDVEDLDAEPSDPFDGVKIEAVRPRTASPSTVDRLTGASSKSSSKSSPKRRRRVGGGAAAAEESEYDAVDDRPEAVVRKARERFEEFENTQEWHAKIKTDAENYAERLEEIYAILKSKGVAGASARDEIKLGVEAVRQWHATVSKDLRMKLTVMEVALQKLAYAKAEDGGVRVSALSEDIDDELAALTTTNGRLQALEETLNKLMRALTVVERREREEPPSRAKRASPSRAKTSTSSSRGTAKTGADESHAPEDLLRMDDDAPTHEEVMKTWNDVAEQWTGSGKRAATKSLSSSDVARMRPKIDSSSKTAAAEDSDDETPASTTGSGVSDLEVSEWVADGADQIADTVDEAKPTFKGDDAPWVRARLGSARLGSARLGSTRVAAAGADGAALGVELLPGATLADVLKQIVSVVMNVTDALDGKKFRLDGDALNVTVTVNSSDVSAAPSTSTPTSPNAVDATREAREARLGAVLKASIADAAAKAFSERRASNEQQPRQRARLGSSWGSNEWTGTDAADATWDPIRGDGDVDTGIYVDDASTRLDSTAPPRRGDEDATTLRATPTPREEDFQGQSKKKIVEAFAKAEHKSAEAWRQEAMKAQRKLEELSAKGMEDDADLKKTASSVSKLKGLVREFKKALLKETKARAEAERALEEETTRSAEAQEDTEKRVVEQAKLQILAARAEARDASLARIEAEREAEKAVKEKVALAKAAAKVQASADKALKNLMADAKKVNVEDDSTVAGALNAAAKAAGRVATGSVPPAPPAPPPEGEGEETKSTTTWDSAVKEVEADASKSSSSASAGRASTSKSKSSTSSTSDDVSGEHTFETALKIKAYDVSKKDVKLIRAAALSLLDARARGACDDDRLTVRKTTDSDGSAVVRLSCAGVPAADVVDRAHDAMRWAFDRSHRFGVNLVKIGFKAGDETDVELFQQA